MARRRNKKGQYVRTGRKKRRKRRSPKRRAAARRMKRNKHGRFIGHRGGKRRHGKQRKHSRARRHHRLNKAQRAYIKRLRAMRSAYVIPSNEASLPLPG
jgi:hypothetical protein